MNKRAQITRNWRPFVRYTLKIPSPLALRPRLKYRDCTANRPESGNNRTANGSSNDSSTSRGVKELFHSNGGFSQSNSIGRRLNGLAPPIHGIYNVITHTPGKQSRRKYVVNTRMGASFSRIGLRFSPGSLADSNDLKQDFFDSLWRKLSSNAII